MITDIATTEFESYHNVKPRGRGFWVFNIYVSLRNQARDFSVHDFYSVAKMRAINEGNKVGAIKITLDGFQSKPGSG